ncbi:MAG: CHAT domain-containing protein [Myxococcota bacterium]
MLWLLATALACPLERLEADLNAAYAAGRSEEAVRLATERVDCATRTAKDEGSAWLDLALVTEGAGDFEGSLPAWVQVTKHLEAGPDRASAWLRVGLDRGLTGDLDGAVADLERAVAEASEGSQRTDAQIWLARVMAKGGRPEDALALLEDVRPETPEEVRQHGAAASIAWSEVMHARREAGDPAGALAAARSSLDAVADQDGMDRVMAELAYGQRLLEAGHPEESLPHLKTAQEAFAAGAPGTEGDLVATSSLARGLGQAGRYDAAISLAERAVELAEAGFGAEHPEVGEARHHLAIVLQGAGRMDEADAQFRAGLEVMRAALGSDDPDVLFMELDQLRFESDRGRPGVALGRIDPLLARWIRVRGPTHLDTLATAGLRCELLRAVGRIPEAVQCAGRAREALEGTVGDHPVVVGAYATEALCLDAFGDPHGALDRVERALAMQARLEPDARTETSLRMTRARYLADTGRRDEAVEALGKSPPDGGSERSLWFQVSGELIAYTDPAGALAAFRKALDSADAPLPRSAAHSGIGFAQLQLGQLEAAERSMKASLAISEEVYGPDDSRNAESLYNLSTVQIARKDDIRALATLDRISVVFAKTGVSAHPTYARALASMGTVLARGHEEEALGLLDRAVVMADASLGRDHVEAAALRLEAGKGYFTFGKLDRARELATEATATLEASLGPTHPRTLAASLGVAGIDVARGDGAGALTLLDAVDAAFLAQGMKRSPDRAGLLTVRSAARALTGDASGAAEDSALALDLESRLLDTVMSSSERQRLAAVQRGHLPLTVYVHAASATDAYERGLAWKGLASAAFLGSREPDPELARVRNQLAALAFSPPAGMSSVERREALESLVARKDALQAEVKDTRRKTDWRAVCRSLPDDTAVVDFFRGRRYDGGQEAETFEAFVLTGGDCREVTRVTLDLHAVHEAHLKYRKVVGSQGAARVADRVGTALREVLWDPLVPSLGGRTKVVVIPEPELANVSLAGLPDASGRYLVEDYALRSVSHLREVTADAPVSIGSAVVIGGVEYGKDAPPEASERAGCGWAKFASLPGALEEAKAIRKTLTKRREVSLLTGSDASEARVREAMAGADVIHLATHGFHAGPQCSFDALDTDLAYGTVSTYALVAGMNPMVLSGLALAGANDRDGTTEHDGVLTAEEVAGMGLKADLVVLSACESGLGDVAPGEGVLGLQRGFRQAGAKRIVYSLWQVPDEATRTLMVAFYRELAAGRTPAESLRAAQLEVLAANRKAFGAGHPTDWAAFVMGG